MAASRGLVCVLGSSSSGIGSALAKRLSARGFTLHFGCRRQQQLDEMLAQHKQTGSLFDATHPSTIEQAIKDAAAAAKASGTHLSGLAYCAGSIPLRSLRASKPEDFMDGFQINTVGAAVAMKAALPHLSKAPGGGSVVLFSSVAARTGFAQHAVISAAKGGIEGLTVAAAAELSPAIRVNAIAPSLTDTPLAHRVLGGPSGGAAREAMGKLHPLGRLGTADDIAALAAFLLDSSESGWMTGQIINCDGGRGTIHK